MLPIPTASTRRLLLAVLVALAIPFEAAAIEPAAPPSVSCLGPEGESYLRGLLDRIHQLERQLDAANAQRIGCEGFDPEGAKQELAALKAALDEATTARRKAEADAASAAKAAAAWQADAEATETRVTAAPPILEPAPKVEAAAPSPTATPALVSESERAAAQLAALTGRRPSSASGEAPPLTAPKAPDVAPPASPPAAEASSVEPRYVRTRCDQSPETAPIAPGDRLAIRVEHMEEVSGTVEVARDGRIRLPLLGSVPASGRNQRELVADLSQRLTVYLQTPRVEVALERDCAK